MAIQLLFTFLITLLWLTIFMSFQDADVIKPKALMLVVVTYIAIAVGSVISALFVVWQ